jgi:hypothetical protein
LLGHSHGEAARHDRHFVDGIGVRHDRGDQRMPGFVIGQQLDLLVGEHHTLALQPHQDPVSGALDALAPDGLSIFACGSQRRLVEQIGQLCATETRRAPRQTFQVDIGRQGLVLGVDLQEFNSDRYLSISSPRLHSPEEAPETLRDRGDSSRR